MESKKIKLVLAMTVIAVPLVFTGCSGCGKSVDEVPVDDAVVESTTNTDVNETIEEDLADAGIVVTPETTPEADASTLDESMSGTYYVIAEEGIPYYAEDDTTSDVLGTLVYDTEVTALGMSTETNLFQIELEDGTKAWVESGNLDVVKGGYQVVDDDTATETPSEGTSEEKTEVEQNAEDFMNSLTEEEKQELMDSIQSSQEEYNPFASYWEQVGQDENAGVGQAPIIEDNVLGTGEGWTGGQMIMD